ncbi:MAG: class II aldolase/adducin family protein [Bifidobacteriaceae bacterium]|jgi:rhamnulose-1-phosphate aldolase|nr:class II aldolase/adducin family protein [Bifidobacteriaceae bacterium]
MIVSLPIALEQIGLAGARLDSIHACEAGAGNISVVLREAPGLDAVFPLAEPFELPVPAPHLAGWTALVTGSGQRLRDVVGSPRATLAAVAIGGDGRSGVLRSAPERAWRTPTSEFNSHLAAHEDRVARCPDLDSHAVVHAQPPYLVALSHAVAGGDSVAFNRRIMRWEPETIVQLPDGLAVLEFMVPGSRRLQEASVAALREHRIVVWSKHGVLGRSDTGPLAIVDLIEYAETGALYEHLNAAAGGAASGLTSAELRAVVEAFSVEADPSLFE